MEITIHGDSRPLEGLFSFVLYWRPRTNAKFVNSKYYRGLHAYKTFLETNPFFANIAMIVYTDEQTFPILQEHLSGPQILFAVVSWPEYTHEGVLDGGILRCARFQAMEQFPDAWIAIRDADTLFPAATKNASFAETLGAWEQAFLQTWLSTRPSETILGVNHAYQQAWHINMLFPNRFKKNTKQSSLMQQVGITREILRRTSKNKTPQFRAPLGIYAGFVNLPPGIHLWSAFEVYLRQRFYMLPDGLSNKDSLIPGIGKDERLLLFVLLPQLHEHVFYFGIDYEDEESDPAFLNPAVPPHVFAGTYHDSTHESFKEIFDPFLESYLRWAEGDPATYERLYEEAIAATRLNMAPNALFHPKRTRRRRASRTTTRRERKKGHLDSYVQQSKM